MPTFETTLSIAAMERVIQDYTESRRKAFYEEESNERIEVEDLDLSQLLPLASFISNMKNLINLASDLKQVKLEWHWSWQFILSIYPLHFLVGMHTPPSLLECI